MSGERGAEQLDRQDTCEHAQSVIDALDSEEFPYFGEVGDLERDARWCAQAVLAYEAALAAAEQRAEQAEELADVRAAKLAKAFPELAAAERRVGELEAQLAARDDVVRTATAFHRSVTQWGTGSAAYANDEVYLRHALERLSALAGSVSEAETPQEPAP